MKKLHVLFDLQGKHVSEEMHISQPYEFLVFYIGSDIGHSISSCQSVLAGLREALAGRPFEPYCGNGYELTANATTASIARLLDEDNIRTFPTSIVYEAIEQWMQFMQTHGRDRVVKTERHG